MAAGFNFNNITLSGEADVSNIMENFSKIEQNGIKYEDAKAKATTSADGIMSKEDKSKLDNIEDNAEANNINQVNFNGTSQSIAEGILNLNETDPTVPNWAKAETKPSYNWDEIGNKPNFVTQTTVTNFWTGTQAEYDELQTKTTGTLYLIQES